MPKRYTETDKWDDVWFRSLPPAMKLLWVYLCDRCDWAGVWEIDKADAAYRTGLTDIDWDMFFNACNDNLDSPRLVVLSGNRHWWLRKFVLFQFPDGLSESVRPHKPALRSLHRFGLTAEVVEMYRQMIRDADGFHLEPATTDEKPNGKPKKQTPPNRRIAMAYKSAFEKRFDTKYEPSAGDYAQIVRLLKTVGDINPDEFVKAAELQWERGKYKPNASMSIAGVCSKWAAFAAAMKEQAPTKKKEYTF